METKTNNPLITEMMRTEAGAQVGRPLHQAVSRSLDRYFEHADNQISANIWDAVMDEVIPPLLDATMRYTRGNQVKAAKVLGKSRGTLRKYLHQYNTPFEPKNPPLREAVEKALTQYFSHLDGHVPANLWELVMEEVIPPLLRAVMRYTRGNQVKAAKVLTKSRGTLRKYLEIYNLD